MCFYLFCIDNLFTFFTYNTDYEVGTKKAFELTEADLNIKNVKVTQLLTMPRNVPNLKFLEFFEQYETMTLERN